MMPHRLTCSAFAALLLLAPRAGLPAGRHAQTPLPGSAEEPATAQSERLPDAQVGVEYEVLLQPKLPDVLPEEMPPFEWKLVKDASLPPGLELFPNGKLEGVPAKAQKDAYRFKIEQSDPTGAPEKVIHDYTLLVRPLPFGMTPAARFDERGTFEASFYSGLAIDSFAAGEVNKLLNPDASGELRERAVAGFDFAYRLWQDNAPPGKSVGDLDLWNPQLWVYGETVHGMRSTDFECKQADGSRANIPRCSLFDPAAGGEQTIYILRNATSLEAFAGLRFEFATLRRQSDSPANLYVKTQYGFLSVAGRGGDVVDVHQWAALGLIATKGRYTGSYFEMGYGRTDLFASKSRSRWKFDAFLTWGEYGLKVLKFRPFVQMVADTDLGHGSDSVQTYIGFDFDLDELFKKPPKSGKPNGH